MRVQPRHRLSANGRGEGVCQVAIDEDWSALRFRRVEHIKTMQRDAVRAATEPGNARVAKKDGG